MRHRESVDALQVDVVQLHDRATEVGVERQVVGKILVVAVAGEELVSTLAGEDHLHVLAGQAGGEVGGHGAAHEVDIE